MQTCSICNSGYYRKTVPRPRSRGLKLGQCLATRYQWTWFSCNGSARNAAVSDAGPALGKRVQRSATARDGGNANARIASFAVLEDHGGTKHPARDEVEEADEGERGSEPCRHCLERGVGGAGVGLR